MPIKVPDNLPAKEILNNENIFVMDESVAYQQDIRPLRIAILNLMPTKETTETQLLRLIGNTPLQVEVVLLHPRTHTSKNTSADHLESFYKTFDEISHEYYDGLIITGAPVEHMPFDEVNYWEELKEIMDWSARRVTSTFHICWAAQAGLYHHFNIPKYNLDEKMFGVYPHTIEKRNVNLLRGFDEMFLYRSLVILRCAARILSRLKSWIFCQSQLTLAYISLRQRTASKFMLPAIQNMIQPRLSMSMTEIKPKG